MVSAYDELWRGGPRFLSDAGAFRVSTDSVLLGAFAARIRAKTILDLGCGSGVLAVLLGLSHPGAAVEAVDIQPEAAARAAAAMELNGLSPAGVRCGDLRDHRALFAAGRFFDGALFSRFFSFVSMFFLLESGYLRDPFSESGSF